MRILKAISADEKALPAEMLMICNDHTQTRVLLDSITDALSAPNPKLLAEFMQFEYSASSHGRDQQQEPMLAVELFAEEHLRQWMFRPLLCHCRSVMAKDPSGEQPQTKVLLEALTEVLAREGVAGVEATFLKKELAVGKVEDQLQPFWTGKSLHGTSICLCALLASLVSTLNAVCCGLLQAR